VRELLVIDSHEVTIRVMIFLQQFQLNLLTLWISNWVLAKGVEANVRNASRVIVGQRKLDKGCDIWLLRQSRGKQKKI